MKKVRLAVGVVGAAAPALGLMMPAAPATAAVAHPALAAPGAVPAYKASCGSASKTKLGPVVFSHSAETYHAEVIHSGSCIREVYGSATQKHYLSQRLRMYSLGGAKVYSGYKKPNSATSSHTIWKQWPYKSGIHTVCAALVQESSHKLVAGPVCGSF